MKTTSPVVKRTITITVLTLESDPFTFDTLTQLDDEITHGPSVGGWEVSAPTPVDNVTAELRALGNDGTFFDEEEE